MQGASCVLLKLCTGAELAACMQVVRGSVDNCRFGWSGKMCELLGDELIEGGFGVAG